MKTIREQLAEEHRRGDHDHAMQDGVGIDDCPGCEADGFGSDDEED